jgi:hypothetical protein
MSVTPLPSKIYTAQETLAALINADARPANVLEAAWPPIFNDPDPTKAVEAITQRKGNIALSVQAKLQALGAGVIVMLPLITKPDPSIPVPAYGLKFVVVATTNPLIFYPKTGKSGEAMVERILLLVDFKPNGVASNDRTRAGLFTIDRNAVQLMEPTQNQGGDLILSYQINVNTNIIL